MLKKQAFLIPIVILFFTDFLLPVFYYFNLEDPPSGFSIWGLVPAILCLGIAWKDGKFHWDFGLFVCIVASLFSLAGERFHNFLMEQQSDFPGVKGAILTVELMLIWLVFTALLGLGFGVMLHRWLGWPLKR